MRHLFTINLYNDYCCLSHICTLLLVHIHTYLYTYIPVTLYNLHALHAYTFDFLDVHFTNCTHEQIQTNPISTFHVTSPMESRPNLIPFCQIHQGAGLSPASTGPLSLTADTSSTKSHTYSRSRQVHLHSPTDVQTKST